MDPETTGRSGRPGGDLIGELADQVGRLADRLRSLSDVRLARPLPPAGSRADAGHALAQRLAADAAALTGEPARAVPRLHDFAVGDQVAVTGTDLVRALRLAAQGAAQDAAQPVERAGDPATATARERLAGAAIEAVRALRAAL